MEDLKALITNLVDIFSGDIREFYKIYESYLIDLIISKKIDISLIIDQIKQKEAKDNLYSIIAATNSAFLTIGVSKSELMADNELYKESYEKNKSMFNTYLSFLQLGLKDYINKLLFNIILDYLINNKIKLIENLDLFDLLPYEFRNKLSRFRNKSNISGKIKKQFTNFKNDLFQYFDPSNLIFKVEDFQSDQLGETISEKEMLEKLEEARQDNIKTIKLTSNHINNEALLNNGEIPSLLSYFENFSKLNYSVIDKIVINLKQIRKFITSSPDFLDLENLFYAVNIFKMFGEELLLEIGYVENVVKNFISGKVFSTGRYHIPSAISIYYGLSVFSDLNLLNNSELVDLVDIETFLENELNPFIPEKLDINFYAILSLIILKKSGGIITNKNHLIEPLTKLDLFNLERFKPSSDMFFYLSLLKLLDNRFDFHSLQASYLAELDKKILPNGSINGSTTDTARTLLILVLLDLKGKGVSIISELLKFLNQNLNFFIESKEFGDFNFYHNKIAFKIELRMLFWMLLALSQYF